VADHLARAGQGGVNAVTMVMLTGSFEVIGDDGPRPVTAMVQGFAALSGAASLRAAPSRPQEVRACAAERGGQRVLWIVNLTPRAC